MISRRQFARGSALAWARNTLLPWSNLAQTLPSTEKEFPLPGAPQRTRQEWLEQAAESANRKTRTTDGQLQFGRFRDRIYWLLQPMNWKPSPEFREQEGYPEVTVPVGFVTDLASIPRIFYTILPPDAEYTVPAIVHDYLYWTQSVTRTQADNIINFSMRDYHIGPITRNLIYEGVHLGGSLAWKDNAKARLGGEKRILTRFPKSSNVKWSEWKSDPQNFS